jgi:hypothetical protein
MVHSPETNQHANHATTCQPTRSRHDNHLNYYVYRLACFLQNQRIIAVFDYQSLVLSHVAARFTCLVHCQILSPHNFQLDNLFIFYNVYIFFS